MGTSVADSKTPAFVAFALVAFGLVIGAAQGLTHGSIAGGVIAAMGAIPACYGMWKGIQQETQGTLAISVIAVLVALGAGALLIVLGVINWFR
jgi:hypothetical protein